MTIRNDGLIYLRKQILQLGTTSRLFVSSNKPKRFEVITSPMATTDSNLGTRYRYAKYIHIFPKQQILWLIRNGCIFAEHLIKNENEIHRIIRHIVRGTLNLETRSKTNFSE